MTLVGYARVSSTGQSLEVQQEQLRAAGCEKIFAEKRSGKSTDDRSALKHALEWVREGDTLVVTKLDRLARSGRDLYLIVDQLSSKNVGFRCLSQGAVDTTTPMGKLVLGILGAVAEFELDIRQERQRDGIERAKRERPEVYRGRRPTVDQEAIRKLRAEGVGPSAIAKKLGYGRMTVYRALKGEPEPT
ncbi:recombinase family protein [Sphingomonas crocodyli]|uniref:Recombinase family protein n=1 Tax=Sphingomonas crocodyli TaxID=1979270 RepID=A0A437M6T1_9SPHN|nr:recombinase family protein [Sphingomonas crocodyli]RVT93420.1 recombinase family protein [Sphingomonas crocodyli]